MSSSVGFFFAVQIVYHPHNLAAHMYGPFINTLNNRGPSKYLRVTPESKILWVLFILTSF